MDETSTGTVVQQFLAGRSAMFQELHARTGPRLRLWCSLRVPWALWHRLDPTDLEQEVWLRAMALLPRYDRHRAGFRSWLFGIAANVLAEQLRRLHVRAREGSADGSAVFAAVPDRGTAVVARAARSEEVERLLRAVEALPPADRLLVVQRGLEGVPFKGVATALGISPEAAEIRWRRLCERLRQRFAEAGLGAGFDAD